MYVVFTKENCTWCENLKTVLNENNIDFRSVVIGRDIERDTFLNEYPEAKTVPWVTLEDGTVVGGHKDMMARLQ